MMLTKRELKLQDMKPICPECGADPEGSESMQTGGRFHKRGCKVNIYLARLHLWERAT